MQLCTLKKREKDDSLQQLIYDHIYHNSQMGSKKLAVKAYRPEIKQLTSIVTIILENALKE